MGFLKVLLVGMWLAGAALPACAFIIVPSRPSPTIVVEFYNVATGHYFYTRSPEEIGGAGAGWTRTGLEFFAYSTREASRFQGTDCDVIGPPCKPIARFYSPRNNSHFFSGSEEEVRDLGQSGTGWVFEGDAFFVPMPNPDGTCPGFPMTPVHRLYNNRHGFNDGNHRYTTSLAVRDEMVARGWTSEGVAFCAYGSRAQVAETYEFQTSSGQSLQPLDRCRFKEEPFGNASCVGFENLQIPRAFAPGDDRVGRDAFNARVGWSFPADRRLNIVQYVDAFLTASSHTFLQLTTIDGRHVAFYLNGRDRGSGPASRIVLVRKLWTEAPSGNQDDFRFFPFRVRFGTPQEIEFSFGLGLTAFEAGAGGTVAGGGAIEFRDSRSGGSLRFDAAAYGTVRATEDSAERDAFSGVPVVRSEFGRTSRYGRLAGPFVTQATSFLSDRGQAFILRMSSGEFQAVIDAARGLAPWLSADPEDYMVVSFEQVNEVVGDGEIALWQRAPQVTRRPAP